MHGMDISAAALGSVVLELFKLYESGRDAWQAPPSQPLESELSCAYLERATLIDVQLELTVLTLANLKNAFLFRANLRGAALQQAELGSADLGTANVRGANLRQASLQNSDLQGANLSYRELASPGRLGDRAQGRSSQPRAS
jgi:hypothetical protein